MRIFVQCVRFNIQFLLIRNYRANSNLQCNVLVDDGDNARLVDFALVPVLSTTTFTTTNVVGPARWQAPEVFLTEEEDHLPFTLKTDVFSFSMFTIEVRHVACVRCIFAVLIFSVICQLLTKEHPFNHRKLDTVVIMDITRNLRPRKPVQPLADELWPILERCWAQAPGNRPSMATVCEGLGRIQSHRSL